MLRSSIDYTRPFCLENCCCNFLSPYALQSTWGQRLFPILYVITNQVSKIKGEFSYGTQNFKYMFNEQRHVCYYKIKIKMIGKPTRKHKEIKTMRINITHPLKSTWQLTNVVHPIALEATNSSTLQKKKIEIFYVLNLGNSKKIKVKKSTISRRSMMQPTNYQLPNTN